MLNSFTTITRSECDIEGNQSPSPPATTLQIFPNHREEPLSGETGIHKDCITIHLHLSNTGTQQDTLTVPCDLLGNLYSEADCPGDQHRVTINHFNHGSITKSKIRGIEHLALFIHTHLTHPQILFRRW